MHLYDRLLLHQGRGDRRLSLGPLQHMTGAGISLMPAFDKLATSLIGDNPALTEALRSFLPQMKGVRDQDASCCILHIQTAYVTTKALIQIFEMLSCSLFC